MSNYENLLSVASSKEKVNALKCNLTIKLQQRPGIHQADSASWMLAQVLCPIKVECSSAA